MGVAGEESHSSGFCAGLEGVKGVIKGVLLLGRLLSKLEMVDEAMPTDGEVLCGGCCWNCVWVSFNETYILVEMVLA